MNPTPQEYAQALYDHLLETPVKHQARAIRIFVETVRQHQQIKSADKIIDAVSEMFARQSSSYVLHLISAQPLHNLITISRAISSTLGHDIEIRNYINPGLIGGLIVRFNNYKIDISLQSHIQKARKNQSNPVNIPDDLKKIIDIIIQNQTLLFSEEILLENEPIEIVDLSTSHKVKLAPLEKRLSAQLHQKVIIHYNLDPNLIGGAVIKYNNNKYDVTIDQQLDSVQT